LFQATGITVYDHKTQISATRGKLNKILNGRDSLICKDLHHQSFSAKVYKTESIFTKSNILP